MLPMLCAATIVSGVAGAGALVQPIPMSDVSLDHGGGLDYKEAEERNQEVLMGLNSTKWASCAKPKPHSALRTASSLHSADDKG